MVLITARFLTGLAIGLSTSVFFNIHYIFGNTHSPGRYSPRLVTSDTHNDNDKHIVKHPLDVTNRTLNNVVGPDEDDFPAVKVAMSRQRVLVILPITAKFIERAQAARDTWVKRMDKVVYLSDETIEGFHTVDLNVSEGRGHLTAKTMQGFRYVYENHLDDADWFMKADDDTYVIVENLKYFLTSYSPDQPVYFGQLFRGQPKSEYISDFVKQGYYSGGGGYVLSKEALRRLYTYTHICRQDGGYEDLELGICMLKTDVSTVNTTDAFGRSRFHSLPLVVFVRNWFHPEYIHLYNTDYIRPNTTGLSSLAITFHYQEPHMMRAMEYYVYSLRPYGVDWGNKRLNAHHPNTLRGSQG